MNVSGWRTADVGVAGFCTVGADGLRGTYDLNVQAGAERLEMADDKLLIRRRSCIRPYLVTAQTASHQERLAYQKWAIPPQTV